jgi:hypothetical protein
MAMQHNSVTTEGQLSGLIPYKSGAEWKGNSRGRPKDSRHKLSEIFLAEFLEVWTVKGKAALYEIADKYPDRFVTVAASLLPKQDLDDLEDKGLTIRHHQGC